MSAAERVAVALIREGRVRRAWLGVGAIRRPLDVPDLVDDDGVVRARLLFAVSVGRQEPIPDQEVVFATGGKIVTVAESHAGQVDLAADRAIDYYGVYRKSEAEVEQEVRVVRPGIRPLILFDADLPPVALANIDSAEVLVGS